MVPGRWQQIEDIFEAALDQPASERRAYLDQACGNDRELRQEVESLLAHDTGEADLVANIVSGTAVSFMEGTLPPGTMLGPYRVISELGKGGMGSIYLAARADAVYEKTVAIKLVRRGMDNEALLTRFRHERRILAALDHPYIARILDGGTTPDGRPYFVMEYVEGQPITKYCTKHNVSLEQRCELFAKVCEAVSYAHRNLVVHRDLKPANIFVTEDGTPKLLDFGIAKLLASDSSPITQTMAMLPLTPDYASPEQVRGERITTATDVYSLGAVLFEMVTGKRAHEIETATPIGVNRSNAAWPTEIPEFDGRRGVLGDLQAIVRVAMRTDVGRRYSSVDQLRDDIKRAFSGLPVTARADRFTYRTAKFLGRHRWTAAAAALVLISLLTSSVLALTAARKAEAARGVAERERARAEDQRVIAEQERFTAEVARARALQQSQLAEAHRQTAEREHTLADRERDVAREASRRADERATDLTELANKSLFEVHGEIARLPGAFEARKLIVATTLDSLERLSRNAGDTPSVLKALGTGYLRLADLQGYPNQPNLGQYEAALQSYARARQYLTKLEASGDHSLELKLQLLEIDIHAGRVFDAVERPTEAYQLLLPARDAYKQLRHLHPDNLDVIHDQGNLLFYLSRLDARIHGKGLPDALQAVDNFSVLVKSHQNDIEVEKMLAGAYAGVAYVLHYNNRDAEGIPYLKLSAGIREKLLPDHPFDIELKRDLIVNITQLAEKMTIAGVEPELASSYYRRTISLAAEVAAKDESDRMAKSDLANTLLRVGQRPPTAADQKESIPRLLKAEKLFKELIRDSPKDRLAISALISVYNSLGKRYLDLAAYDNAERYLESAKQWVRSSGQYSVAIGRQQIFLSEQYLLMISAYRGDRVTVAKRASELPEEAAQSVAAFPEMRVVHFLVPAMHASIGDAYQALAATASGQIEDRRKACVAYNESVEEWKKLAAKEDVSSWRDKISDVTAKQSACSQIAR